jgi:hypothetical protein
MSEATKMDIEMDIEQYNKLLSIELTPQKINTLNTLRRFERLPDNNYTSVPKTNCTELSLNFMDIISSSELIRCNTLQTLMGTGLKFEEVKRLLEQHFNFLKFKFFFNTIQDLEKYLPANHATIGSLKHPHGLHHAVIFIKNNANMLSLADLQQDAIFNGLPAIESYFINNNYDTSVIGLWWGKQNIEVQNRPYIPPQYRNGGKKQKNKKSLRKNKNKKSLRKNKNKKSLRKNKNKKSLRKKQFNS